MPRSNWRPNLHVPVGFALPLLEIERDNKQEDKPTVLVDPYAEGMELGLIEAVCTALEVWKPRFSHYVDPPPPPQPKARDSQDHTFVVSESWDTRRIPVFRGAHADKVRAFQTDIVQYTTAHQIEPSKQVLLRIASKYVHIRVTPLQGNKDVFGHPDTTQYHREVIRPYVRRSDLEWDRGAVLEAQQGVLDEHPHHTHSVIREMLDHYDATHKTALLASYDAEVDALFEMEAHLWEHWRLPAYYVQDVADTWRDDTHLDARPTGRR